MCDNAAIKRCPAQYWKKKKKKKKSRGSAVHRRRYTAQPQEDATPGGGGGGVYQYRKLSLPVSGTVVCLRVGINGMLGAIYGSRCHGLHNLVSSMAPWFAQESMCDNVGPVGMLPFHAQPISRSAPQACAAVDHSAQRCPAVGVTYPSKGRVFLVTLICDRFDDVDRKLSFRLVFEFWESPS